MQATSERKISSAARSLPGWAGIFCRILTALGLALAAAGAAPGQPPPAPRVIRVVMDGNYPPYAFKDAQGNLQGIAIDQWRLWEKKTGRNVELHGLDLAEARLRMRAGEFDVIDTLFKTAEHLAYLEFTAPYARSDHSIFFRKEISGITGLASLRGFPVAAKAGSVSTDLLLETGGIALQLFSSYEEMIRAASEHKVNLFVMDQAAARYLLNQQDLDSAFAMSAPVFSGELHRAVRKGETGLRQLVESGFAAISPAELGQIDEKWYGRPFLVHATLRLFGQAALAIAAGAALLLAWNWILREKVRTRTRELRESEERYRRAEQGSTDGLWEWNITTGGQYCSPRWLEILGYTAGEAPKDFAAFQQLIHPDDVAQVLAASDRSRRGGRPFAAAEMRLRRKDGSYVSVLSRGLLSAAAGGKVEYMSGVITDLTARNQAEAARRESEERFRKVFVDGPLGIGMASLPDGRILNANPVCCALFGYTEAELQARTFAEFTHPDDRAKDLEVIGQLIAGKIHHHYAEKRYLRKSGEVLWGARSLSKIASADGKTFYGLAMIQDITERKLAEEKIIAHIAELQRWQLLTNGREERVLELKREVNGLLARLGQPPRYASAGPEDPGPPNPAAP